jgi:molecular chaperone HtpG
MSTSTETHSFQADVNAVLSIVVNSLYSHKEIFLRELISNASDALDRLSFESLTNHNLLDQDEELHIEIVADKKSRTLTIRDNGVGMNREDLIQNLGTIARSGSKQLMQSLSDDKDKNLSLIGQFGVGFYSAYLVADEVRVQSRAAGADESFEWCSQAQGDFQVNAAERSGHGTDLVLSLKEAEDEFLDEWRLRELVRKYSDYVRYPIRLQVERPVQKEGEEESEEDKDKDKDKEPELELKWETINSASAVWQRPKAEVTEEQYHEFYKHLSHDWQPPLAHVHFKIEGVQQLSGILFVPEAAPFDLFEPKARGVRLFVKRVFIMDEAQELLPEWLRFVRGVVDSDDLPLNVSREILQQDRTTQFIRKQVVLKTIGLLEELADEDPIERDDKDGNKVEVRRYSLFWKHFGRVLKEGVHHEPEHRERLSKLLRYSTSYQEEPCGLTDYAQRMQEDQPGIYYITAASQEMAQNSPHIEALRGRGYEVLYLTDPIDEWVVQSLPEFDGKKLIAAAKGALDLPESDEEKSEREKQGDQFKVLVQSLQSTLGEQVKETRMTHRLTESPACLVTDEHGLTPHMEQILRANGRDIPVQKRILELNPEHPVVQSLNEMAADPERKDEVADWGRLLFDQALVSEGSLPEDPARFAQSISKLMQKAAGAG